MGLLAATRRFEVDEPTMGCGSETVCASRDASGDIDDDPTDAVVGVGCADASLYKSFGVKGEGELSLVCSNDVGLLMTIVGTTDGKAGIGFDVMALPISLVSHRPTVKGMMLRNLRERVI